MTCDLLDPSGPPLGPSGRRETAPITEDEEAVYMEMSGPSPSAGAGIMLMLLTSVRCICQ